MNSFDGTVFDSSYNRNQPFDVQIGVGKVIKGWDQGIVGMCVGEKRRLVIPPELGYGSRVRISVDIESFWTEDYAGQIPIRGLWLAILLLWL